MIQDLVVQGEITARNDINTSILLDLPVLKTQSLRLLQKVITRDLLPPVSLRGLFEVTKSSYTRETENRPIGTMPVSLTLAET